MKVCKFGLRYRKSKYPETIGGNAGEAVAVSKELSSYEAIAYILEACKDQWIKGVAEEDQRSEEGREGIDKKNLALAGLGHQLSQIIDEKIQELWQEEAALL